MESFDASHVGHFSQWSVHTYIACIVYSCLLITIQLAWDCQPMLPLPPFAPEHPEHHVLSDDLVIHPHTPYSCIIESTRLLTTHHAHVGGIAPERSWEVLPDNLHRHHQLLGTKFKGLHGAQSPQDEDEI